MAKKSSSPSDAASESNTDMFGTPPGVDGAAVRVWATEFAETAPVMRPETAQVVAGLLRNAGEREHTKTTPRVA